jgi:hypothetical protein
VAPVIYTQLLLKYGDCPMNAQAFIPINFEASEIPLGYCPFVKILKLAINLSKLFPEIDTLPIEVEFFRVGPDSQLPTEPSQRELKATIATPAAEFASAVLFTEPWA